MQEVCVVVKKKNKITYVSLKKNAKCDGCKACGFGKSNEIVLPVIATECYEIGETVTINMPEKQVPAAYLALYLIPLVFLALGLVIGKLALNEAWMLILGFVFLIVGFIPAFLIDKIARKNAKYMPVITGRIADTQIG